MGRTPLFILPRTPPEKMIDYSSMVVILVFLFIIDWTLTHSIIGMMRKKYPKYPAEKLELNGIVRFCWDKFGYRIGTIIATVVIIEVLVFALIYILPKFNELFYIMIGAYTIVIMIHFANFMKLKYQGADIFDDMYSAWVGEQDAKK